jgi:hypothetical protein
MMKERKKESPQKQKQGRVHTQVASVLADWQKGCGW